MLDMDGVLADWITGVLEMANAANEAGGHPAAPMLAEQVTRFEIDRCFDADQLPLILDAMADPALYGSLNPIPGAAEAIEGLRAAGVHVGVLSSPDLNNPTCASAKLAWLERHFGRDLAAEAILTKDKTQVRCDLLVDDKPEILGRCRPEWTQVVFDQPYNRHLNKLRLTGWAQWPRLLHMFGSRHADFTKSLAPAPLLRVLQ